MTNAKLGRTEFITGILAEELQANLPTVRVSKALAKEILAGDADSVEIRVTKDFATATLDSVETAYTRVLVEKQMSVGFGAIGTFKSVVKDERTFRNPQDGSEVVKPTHLSAKLAISQGLKDVLEATKIN